MESIAERAWRSHPLCLPPLSNLDLSLLHEWFTHHRVMKLQHECTLKEGSDTINHEKPRLLLASSVRLLMRPS